MCEEFDQLFGGLPFSSDVALIEEEEPYIVGEV
jgi:hypothetical protein